MKWEHLLSAQRHGEKSASPLSETRSRFDQDYDRIIFSHPFRKLQDKTQVFPLPEDDFVHTRLTHSLEVASVGRSLGKEAGVTILEHHHELVKEGISYHDFGAITAAAALTHDLGNPPFGHSGESSISSYFKNTSGGRFFQDLVSPEEWADLTQFEGNAQGFRILTHPRYGGLKLTYATLAAFTKYPRSSSSPVAKSRKSQKKYGFTQSEKNHFKAVANGTMLHQLDSASWVRHPLAFLVEAADDICYGIIDLEDGTRLGLIPFEQTRDLLAAIIGSNYSEVKLNKIGTLIEKLAILRAMAIRELTHQTVQFFGANIDQILAGTFDRALTEQISASSILDEIGQLSLNRIYRSDQVLKREASGYVIIEYLMSAFCEAMYACVFDTNKASARNTTVYRLLPDHLITELEQEETSVFQALQIIIDFVSSMTDSSALRLYQILSGNPKN